MHTLGNPRKQGKNRHCSKLNIHNHITYFPISIYI